MTHWVWPQNNKQKNILKKLELHWDAEVSNSVKDGPMRVENTRGVMKAMINNMNFSPVYHILGRFYIETPSRGSLGKDPTKVTCRGKLSISPILGVTHTSTWKGGFPCWGLPTLLFEMHAQLSPWISSSLFLFPHISLINFTIWLFPQIPSCEGRLWTWKCGQRSELASLCNNNKNKFLLAV